MLLIMLLVIVIIDKYQFHLHEYGHVLKIKENLYKNIDDYKKKTNLKTVTIEVIIFTTPFSPIPVKRKIYSEYFTYLEKNSKDIRYQNIIKDIAIGGYSFSKKILNPKLLRAILVSALISTITIIVDMPIGFIGLPVSIILPSIIFLLFHKNGYGSKKLSSKGMSDNYIYHHPENFRYISLKEDKKQLQKKYKDIKIKKILTINIDLNNLENSKINSDNMYKKIIKNYH